MIEDWQEKWANRTKLTCRSSEESIQKWINKNKKRYGDRLFYDWHPKDGFVAYTANRIPFDNAVKEETVPEPYKYAMNSLSYMFLHEAKDLNINTLFHEEVSQWIESFNDDNADTEFILSLIQAIEVEIREGWFLHGFGKPDFLTKLAAYIGEGYEEVLMYKIIKTIITRVAKEDTFNVNTDGSQDEQTD